MDSGLVSDYDYTIFDSNGVRMVKNGMEYPISQEEWKKAHPEHGTIGCKECIFTQTKEEIFLANKDILEHSYLGLFVLPGFTGHLPFFTFKCDCCNELFADYPHGGGYVICNKCDSGQGIKSKPIWDKLYELGYYEDNRLSAWAWFKLFVPLTVLVIVLVLPAMFVDWIISLFKYSKDSN